VELSKEEEGRHIGKRDSTRKYRIVETLQLWGISQRNRGGKLTAGGQQQKKGKTVRARYTREGSQESPEKISGAQLAATVGEEKDRSIQPKKKKAEIHPFVGVQAQNNGRKRENST